MSNLIEENGKALGKAVKDVAGGFCGAIVSIAKDLTTLGKDTINAANPKKDLKVGEIVLAPHPNFPDENKNVRARIVKIEGEKLSLEYEDKGGGFWDLPKDKVQKV